MAYIPIPYVIEKTGKGERAYDIYSRLMEDRIIFIGTEIDDTVANVVMAQLLFLQMENKNQDISIYINSPGGSVSSGLAIYDAMRFVSCDIATYCVGMAASMGAFLLSGGSKGKRYALPNSRIMIHQPWGGFQGQASDIEIHAKEMLKTKKRLNQLMSEHTGKPLEEVERDTDRDNFLSAEEAKNYGIIDVVLEPRGKKQPEKKDG